MTIQINLNNDFSSAPAGRFRSDGPKSGEAFRDDYLIPAFKNNKGEIHLLLDGVSVLPISFNEEAFGGLVRSGIPYEDIKKRFKIIVTEPMISRYKDVIEKCINDAANHSSKS